MIPEHLLLRRVESVLAGLAHLHQKVGSMNQSMILQNELLTTLVTILRNMPEKDFLE